MAKLVFAPKQGKTQGLLLKYLFAAFGCKNKHPGIATKVIHIIHRVIHRLPSGPLFFVWIKKRIGWFAAKWNGDTAIKIQLDFSPIS